MFPSSFKLNRTAVAGVLAVGVTIAISSIGIVRAEHVFPNKGKTFSCSTGTACVAGNSSGRSTWGVYGSGSSSDGVHGITSSTNGNSGTSGISTATTGHAHGIYGRSANGEGVYGITSAADTDGVYGTAGSGWGVFGESSDTSGDYTAVAALGDKSATYIFVGANAGTGASCIIDPNANLNCTGTISGSDERARQRNNSGRHVLTYASQSASATIESTWEPHACTTVLPPYRSVRTLLPLSSTAGTTSSSRRWATRAVST